MARKSSVDFESCGACAEFCTVFSNPVRARIFHYLRDRERPVSELADLVQSSVQNVSQHLRLMRDKGAIRSRREGKQVFYAIANQKFVEGMKLIRDGIFEEMEKRARTVGGRSRR